VASTRWIGGLLVLVALTAPGCAPDDTASARTTAVRLPDVAPDPWPPKLDERYPDLHLVDQTGQPFALSSLEGSVILLEAIGMTCPACQAFAGAHRVGSFGGIQPAGGLPSIDELVTQYARGVTFPSKDVVLVQVLLFDMELGAPTADDARAWAAHFRRNRGQYQVVLAGGPGLHNHTSYDMVPGFQLIDRHFVLRSDATGHHPRHSLYTDLLPMVPKLVAER
jgi:thiol-disulfide isomerase/thioredoxin